MICGRCGKRMTVRYHSRRGQLVPDYVCQREGIEHGEPICQHIPGAAIDEAVGNILVDAVTPITLEVALGRAAGVAVSVGRSRPSASTTGGAGAL
ncbi:MAG: zinc ribbon domain-containing protein [Bryobacterales bacterium]|nr:zinc ribbon domain-containing protein [Bryobacterales bacterium]